MASCTPAVSAGRIKLIPLSLSSLCACRCRPLSSKSVILTFPCSQLTHLRLVLDGPGGIVGLGHSRYPAHRRIIVSVARAEPDRVGESRQQKEEVNGIHSLPMKEDGGPDSQQQASKLRQRIVSGIAIGITGGGVVLAGGWVFTAATAGAAFVAAREYFELVRSRGMTVGMTPPPRYVSRACSIICALLPLSTMYLGQIDVSVTSAAFVVTTALILQRGNPRFAQLSSAIFGLFYCGYLPCFWIKLRCSLAAPALNTRIGSVWPILLGGQSHWTVGLVATLISVSSIIAADTFAFLGGKFYGRTPLTSISPKKTWEGTIFGFCGCILTSVVLSKVFSWPTTSLSAVAFGVLNFFGSVFGDLTESMIKRDAGVKDSGSLIPGHGGVLDRVDSYVFTGALAYSFVKILLPLYGFIAHGEVFVKWWGKLISRLAPRVWLHCRVQDFGKQTYAVLELVLKDSNGNGRASSLNEDITDKA